jgi:AbrB family transcriptional regulator, stage V sporulation protein T
MKATGIVRRIDDLGRVVIPKEIRENMGIKDGDPMEIFIEDTKVIFDKYHALNSLEESAQSFARAIAHTTGQKCLIVNQDRVIGIGGIPNSFLHSEISKDLKMILTRGTFCTILNPIILLENNTLSYNKSMISPISKHNEELGAVIIATDNDFGESERDLIETASKFFMLQLK